MNTLAERVREVIDSNTNKLVSREDFAANYERALGVVPASIAYESVQSTAVALLDVLIEDMEKKREDATTDYAGTRDELDNAYASGCYNTRSDDIDDLKELRNSLSLTKTKDHE